MGWSATTPRALERSAFAQMLMGRDLEAVRALLTSEGELADGAGPIPDRAEQLALTVAHSSLKTMIVTRSVWDEQLQGLADLALAMDLFPDGQSTSRLVFDPQAPSPLNSADTRYVEALRAVVARDGRGRPLGTAVETTLSLGDHRLELRWSFVDSTLVSVSTVSPWPDESVGARFRGMEGRLVQTGGMDRTEVERVAAEVLTLVRGLVHQDR